jgi:hypothetical protein
MPEPHPKPLTNLSWQSSRERSESATIPSGHAQGQFACVVDEHPRFHLDALRWYAALTALAGVRPSDLVVHCVGSASSEILGHLKAQGVAIRNVERFDGRSPHCNKISGALQMADFPLVGMAVLCDTDIAVFEDPRRLNLPPRSVAGKVVDAPVPPLDVILNVFVAGGLNPPPTVRLPWGTDDWTISGNNNGGLYMIPGPLLPRVATAWAHWALWLLDRAELLAQWTVYVDQVAMALALAAEGVNSVPLDVRWNTPTHDPTRIPKDAPEPAIIHYHQEVSRRGLIRFTGIPSIDRRIGEANDAIKEVWAEAAPVRTYNQWLTMTPPEPPSHVHHDDGRAVLSSLLEALQPASVLKVGLGSGVYKGLPIEHFVGIDASEDSLRRAMDERPDGRFALGMLADNTVEADITLCLDQLTYPMDAPQYQDLVALLWKSSRKALIVRGYENPEGIRDPDVRFHEPLSTTLRNVALDAEIYPLKDDPVAPMIVLLRSPADKHPRDFPPATLSLVSDRHPDPLSLITLRLHARRTTGFYPDHAPRLWEYPVVGALIAEHLPPGSRLVDIGAGVTPLAPFLTSRGFVVDTVDPSQTVRTWPPQPDWNEWDFLDYGREGLANRSWNCTLDRLPVRPPFDGGYSISVIEHVPAPVRQALLANISLRIRLGGLVVLTIDLVRGSDSLWNRNLGIEVEEPTLHGTIQDVVEECAAVGLQLFRNDVVRDWGESNVDIGLLALHQTEDHARGRWRATKRHLLSQIQRRSMA